MKKNNSLEKKLIKVGIIEISTQIYGYPKHLKLLKLRFYIGGKLIQLGARLVNYGNADNKDTIS